MRRPGDEEAAEAGPDVSVVVCSLNGADRLDACLTALLDQRDARHEVILVDDGSTDATAAVAGALGVTVISHERNRGLAVARNTGIAAARAPVVAFTDDDCVPPPDWVAGLVAGFAAAPDGVVAVGGGVVPLARDTVARRYAGATAPLAPLELGTIGGGALARLATYARPGRPDPSPGPRPVAALVGANMAFRRDALLAEGGFDERIDFGGEEEDMCRRLVERSGDDALRYLPTLRMAHDFAPRLSDTFRRARAYGRGNARTFLKAGGGVPPVPPFPLLALGVLAAAVRRPTLLPFALALPLLLRPIRGGRPSVGWPERLAYSYLVLAEEAATFAGFTRGWVTLRHGYRGRS